MLIGGLLKFSLIDYPGKVAAVVFTQGCNYRCPFCHNPDLVLPERFVEPLDQTAIMAFLKKRRGLLQGVVVTGGEPTLQPDLPEFLATIRALGFLVKLDTNGSRPQVLAGLFVAGLVDYVAMDIKSSPDHYSRAAGCDVDIEAVTASVALIKASGIEHEFRTTALRAIFTVDDAARISEIIGHGERYNVRRGNLGSKMLAPEVFADVADYTDEEWEAVKSCYNKKA